MTISGFVLCFAGIGVILNGTFTHLGIVVLIEGGVLFTLIDEKRRQSHRST